MNTGSHPSKPLTVADVVAHESVDLGPRHGSLLPYEIRHVHGMKWLVFGLGPPGTHRIPSEFHPGTSSQIRGSSSGNNASGPNTTGDQNTSSAVDSPEPTGVNETDESSPVDDTGDTHPMNDTDDSDSPNGPSTDGSHPAPTDDEGTTGDGVGSDGSGVDSNTENSRFGTRDERGRVRLMAQVNSRRGVRTGDPQPTDSTSPSPHVTIPRDLPLS